MVSYMDTSVVPGLANLGPALGSVVVMGFICWKLMILFKEQLEAIKGFSDSLHAHTRTLDKISANTEANTKIVSRMLDQIEAK